MFAARSAVGPASAGPSMRPSPYRKPSASSSSWPGVRMVTASASPSTRISSGSSTATSSATPSRSISACIPLFRTGVAMAGRYPGPDSLRRPVSTFDRLADLPLEIESYELEGRQLQVSSAFERHTTLIRLQGGGAEGVGEDVTYDAPDQLALQDAGPVAP